MANLRFLSLNCHGLSVDVTNYLSSIAVNYDFILLQETWLSDFNCHRANLISNDFEIFHSSAMEEKLRSGILSGRPFGGTAILSRKKFAGRVSLVNTFNPRITAICLHFTGHPDMLICSVYMPYNDRSAHQLGEYESTIGSLQAVINSHLGCSVLIGGDWNLDKSGTYPAEPLVQQLCSVNNLCWLDPMSNTVDFTYHSDVNGHFSLIDHFLCSNFLVNNSQAVNILVDGNNTSDHYAVVTDIPVYDHCQENSNYCKPFYKLRWDRADLLQYQSLCSNMLSQMQLPIDAILCSEVNCSVHSTDLENYYNGIIECLYVSAQSCIPQVKGGIEKHWWSSDLEDLKQQSIEITNVWHQHGCPRSGAINNNRIKIKMRYKCAIKEAIVAADEEFNDSLAKHFCKKDVKSFWKSWRKRFCSKNLKTTSRLNNRTGDDNILDEFSTYFSKVSQNNTLGADEKYKKIVFNYLESNISSKDCANSTPITFGIVQDIIDSLKPNKAAGHDGIVNEHIVNGGPNLTIHLCLLFTAMIRHSFVPTSFRFGIIQPIPKSKHGDLSKIDMYRGITLSPVISKLFESVMLSVYRKDLKSDYLQFGFKRDSSCSHALFSLSESVRYYNKRGSKVYCAFLDASKAFDKVLTYGLITKLIKRSVPLAFIRILVSWYSSLHCAVTWNSVVGVPFQIFCGVRQGGILSPLLFAVYVDDLIDELRKCGCGLYIGSVFTGALLYADDIALLACSCLGLQKLINVCTDYGLQWDICFNPTKSQIICFGGRHPERELIYIGDKTITWSERVKYLGCYFKCNTGEVDPSCPVGKFYGSFNNIINVLGSKRDEMLTVHLVKTYCLPSLLYGCETWYLNTSDARSVDVAWNNAFRKIFNGFWRDSVKPIQFYCQCLPVTMLIALRKIQFWRKMYYHDSIVLNILANECYHSVMAVAARYNITAYHVMHLNNFALKNLFWSHFTTLVK